MKIYLNGEERIISDQEHSRAYTLSVLIESLSMKPDRVAVELNREIAPRDRWADVVLKDGDKLEIVHFVGGGRGNL